MTRERIKRPEPERTQPLRNWSGAFGSPGQPGSASMPPGQGVPPGFSGSVPPYPGPPGAARDPVSRGVEAGYRVIDEYLRQGQAVARAMWSPFIPGFAPPGAGMPFDAGSPPGASGPFGVGGPPGAPAGNAPPWAGAAPIPEEIQQRMGTMIRHATDLAMMWMDFVGVTAPGAAGQRSPLGSPFGAPVPGAPRTPMAGPFTAGEPAPSSYVPPSSQVPPSSHGSPSSHVPAPAPAVEQQQTLITLAIQSRRPVEVSVDLRPRSAGLALRVHDLRAGGAGEGRIGGVEIEGRPDDDQITIRLQVPDELPPGVYSGLIVDERTSLPRGTLSVRLTAP
ncbi:MAG: hypothetical protein QM820_22850 [Minicystis sp.]